MGSKKILITLFILLGILIISLASSAIYFTLNEVQKPGMQNPILSRSYTEGDSVQYVLEPIDITYLLNEIGAYQLHRTPFSKDTPKIETAIGGRVFFSEVWKGDISTIELDSEDVDLRIITSEDEVFKALVSGNTTLYMQDSVSSGRTLIEVTASETELFSKGYLGLYQDLTGQDLGDLLSYEDSNE